jgi:lipopolysaccharide export system protein LptA
MTGAARVSLLLLGACGPREAAPHPEPGVVLEGVSADGTGWRLVAPRVAFAAEGAQAARVERPALAVEGAPGTPSWDITASESSWDLRGHTARFSGEVAVQRGDLRVRCATLDARWREAAPGGPVLDVLEASGPVELVLGGRTARAERATLRPAEGQLELRGAVRLSLDGGTMEGVAVTLRLDDARVSCRGDAGAPCRVRLASR